METPEIKGAANVAKVNGSADAERKAKKAEAAKRWKENKKAKAEKVKVDAKALKEELNKAGAFAKLSPAMQKFVDELITGSSPSAGGTGSTFNKIFGDNPKVGDKVTLISIVERTFKGKAQIDVLCKKWAEKGISVKFNANAEKPTESTYEIVKL